MNFYKTAKPTLSDSFCCKVCVCPCFLSPLPACAAGGIDGSKHSADTGIRPRPLLLSDWTTPQHLSCCYPEPRRWLAVRGCQSFFLFFIFSVLLGLFSTRDGGLRTCTYVLILRWGMGQDHWTVISIYQLLRYIFKTDTIIDNKRRWESDTCKQHR